MKKSWWSWSTVAAGFLVLSVAVMGACCNMHKEKEEGEDKEGPETKVAFAQLPAPVQATLTKEANGAAVTDADMETKEGKTVYEADITIGGKNWEVVVAADGTVVSKKEDNEEGEKKEGDEKGEKGEKEEQGEHKD